MTTSVRVSSFLVAFLITLVMPAMVLADHAININTADKDTLMTLTGIGETKAQAIIDYRTTVGPFDTIEEIQDVSGIGPSTFASIKDHIVVSGSAPDAGQQAETASSTAQTQTGGSYLTEPQLIADAGADRTVITGADSVFQGKAFKKDGTPIGPAGVRFLWNFGDGKTAEGAQTMHRFAHPGRYAVTLDVSSGVYSAADRVVVTAREAAFTLSTLLDGSAVIQNDSPYDLDLSFWFVRDGERLFAIPEDTVVLVGEKIIIPPDSLGFAAGARWQLLYPNGSTAASTPPPTPLIIHAKAAAKSLPPAVRTPDLEPLASKEEDAALGGEAAVQAASVAATALPPHAKHSLFNQWTLGLFALVSTGAVGAFLAARAARNDWEIVEE